MRFYLFQFAALCAGLLVFSSSASLAAPTTLHLTNGDRITGEILAENPDGSIRFRMSAGPEITLPAAAVEGDKAASATDNEHAAANDIDTAQAPPDTPTQDATQMAAIEPAAPPEQVPFSWGGRIELGAELQTGNSETESLAIDTRLKAREGQNRYQADFDFERSEEEGTITDDSKSLELEYERFQTRKSFVGADADFENDDVAELDLRTRLGVKTGYQFYDRDALSLKASGGLAYLNENFANQSTETSIALTHSLDYEQSFFEDAARLFHEHDFLVPTDDSGAFIFHAESGVRVPVARKFIGTAGVDFDWDNDPAEGVGEEDITYSLKLGYEF